MLALIDCPVTPVPLQGQVCFMYQPLPQPLLAPAKRISKPFTDPTLQVYGQVGWLTDGSQIPRPYLSKNTNESTSPTTSHAIQPYAAGSSYRSAMSQYLADNPLGVRSAQLANLANCEADQTLF